MWFWYATFSAFVSSISIILNKKGLNNINSSLVSWALFAFSIPFLIYPSFKDGFPKLNFMFWIGTFGSAILFSFAKTLALRSLKNSLMSEIVPLAFFSVLFQYIFGLIFFSEVLKTFSLIGLLLIIIGGYLLKIEEAKEDFLRPFKLLLTNKNASFYLIAMTMFVLSSVFDKFAIINMYPANQSLYLLFGNIISTVIISLYMIKKDTVWLKDLRSNLGILFISGIVYTILSLSYLYGITDGSLALVSGVKKLEVFFVLLLGWLIFGDKPKKGVWIGSLIMLLGVILIKVG